MPYKKNKLRMKREAISKVRSEMAKRSNETQNKKRMQEAVKLHVVGGFHTYGSLGYHHIEILDCGHETHYWLSVDGEIRKPQTEKGFRKILCDWMLRRKVKSEVWSYSI